MTIISVLILVIIGLVTGVLAGLLGIGGGIVTVPSFLYFLKAYAKQDLYTMQMAIGTSLAVMIFTAFSSALSHHLKNGILWGFLERFAPGVVIGSVLGAFIADSVPSEHLELFFGVYALFFGVRYLFVSSKKTIDEVDRSLPPFWLSVCMGLLTGAVSSTLGIGGALFTVPFLTWYHTPLQRVISTSAVVGLLIALIGTLSFYFFGLDAKLGSDSFGYIYLPAFLITGIVSVITAPLGAELAYILPVNTLRRVFGAFLVIVGLLLI